MVGAKARFALVALVAFALIAQPSPASAQLDEQLGSLADQAQQTAQEISDSFNQSGSEILNGTEEFATDLGGKLNDTAMAIANKTQQAVSKLNETIQAGAEKIGDFVSNANETIQGAIALLDLGASGVSGGAGSSSDSSGSPNSKPMSRNKATLGPGSSMPKKPRFSALNCSTAFLRSAEFMLNQRPG